MKSVDQVPRVRVAALVLQGDSVLLVRHEKGGASYWLLPGGGVEFGESLDTALRREVREETHLDVRIQELVWVYDSIAPDQSRHLLNVCFSAVPLTGDLRVGSDERVVEARYVGIDELSGLRLHPDLREELVRGIRQGAPQPGVYLGELWTE